MRQPNPEPTSESVVVLPHVVKRGVSLHLTQMLNERFKVGLENYGVPLVTHNGRDARQDCIEELLDAILYAEQHYLETKDERVGDMVCTIVEVLERWVDLTP